MKRALQKALENKMRSRRTETSSTSTKGQTHALYQALKNKKKLPTFTRPAPKKNPEYARMSIEEYEKKYN